MKARGESSETPAYDASLPVLVRDLGAPARSSQPAGAHVDVPESHAWLTALEAVELGLPGCPSERTIRSQVTTGEIASRKRTGRGGGSEFHWSSLPREAAAEYLRRYGKPISSLVTVSPAARAHEKDVRAETRLKIVDLAHAYVARSKRTKGLALEAFAQLYRSRRVRDLQQLDYDLEPTANPNQVREWSRVVRTRGAGALIDGRGRPKGTGFFDKPENIEARNYVIGRVAANGKLTAPDVCADLEMDKGVIVALRTMQKFIATINKANPGLIKAMRNPDQHRSHHRPAFGSRAAHGINQRWELDATRADVMCRVPDGKGGTTLVRPTLIAAIDADTRRAMVLVCDQPSAQATQALLRRMVLEFGVPAVIKTDNGKEFSNRAVKLFCDAAGIDLQFSRPFHPEEKPHVERFFGTLNKGFLPRLPGYVGANIGERKGIESQKSFAHRFGIDAELVKAEALTPAGLQARLDAWCRDEYGQRAHSGLQGKGETPANAALLQADQVRRLPNERALDALLMPLAGTRRVLKKGISVERRFYIAPELGGIMGQAVTVRRDPYDLSRIFVYYGEREEFLCVAVDPQLSGDSAMLISIAAQQLQRRVISQTRTDIRNVLRLHPAGSAADRRLAHLAGDGIALSAEGEQAMVAAQGPAMLAAGAATIAAAEHGKPEKPIEPTAEETSSFADLSARLAVRAARHEQHEGYDRAEMFGEQGELDFCDWFEEFAANGGSPDSDDQARYRDLMADKMFVEIRRLSNIQKEAASTLQLPVTITRSKT